MTSGSLCRPTTGPVRPSSAVNAKFVAVSSNNSIRSPSGENTLVTPDPELLNSNPAAATSSKDRTLNAI